MSVCVYVYVGLFKKNTGLHNYGGSEVPRSLVRKLESGEPIV